ncbi:unnamed protein product [Aphis gossypii]|uniref:Uncharacterized protein n=1 Tax=Aphis gossypii TaxID=80765 RepID=A0A9P0J3J3_APHGO|nr:unnamed protein product [Aphis gossypii]
MRRSPGQRRRISCLGQLSPSPPPLKKQERRTYTRPGGGRVNCVCARARMYLRKTGFRPTSALRHERRRRRFRLSKIAAAAVFFPPFDIVARGVVSAMPESKYSFLFCSCLPRLFYVVPMMVFSRPKTNTHVEKKSIERE